MSKWLSRLLGAAAGSRPPPPAAGASLAPAAAASAEVDDEAAFCRFVLDAGAQVPGSDAATPGEHALLQALDAALADNRGATRVPRMPAIVPQLMQMLRDPARSAADLAAHLAQDPVLVASVLRGANSPAYGARRRIESLDQAVLIVGHDGLRQLALGVATKPLINVQSGRFTRPGAPRVWDQTEKAGVACRLLAPARQASAFEGYLAVLLENMGTVVALRVLDEQAQAEAPPGSGRFCATFLVHARTPARRIGRDWSFPEPVIAAVGSRDVALRSPLAMLVRDAGRIGRLGALVGGGRLDGDEARRLLAGDAALLASFEATLADAARDD